ncbi:hypothetical protein ACFL6U_26255 [Planctomycetota bacterium]
MLDESKRLDGNKPYDRLMKHQSENKSLTIAHVVFFSSLLGLLLNPVFGQTIGIFFDSDVPQIKFAAGDVKTALLAKGFTVESLDLSALSSNYANDKVVIALASNTTVISIIKSKGGAVVPSLGEQAYALRTMTTPENTYWVLGGDINGVMYGALQIAENINLNGFAGTYNEEESPFVLKRGIKFNIPMDERSPTYDKNCGGTAYKVALHHVWDLSFWTTWFDEMARNRFNVLSLWTNHPFTSMIKLDEYPDVVLEDVYGWDENGNKAKIKDMTIDEKIDMWKKVMVHAHNRGFEIFFFTWNINPYGADGKYGISARSYNQETRDYYKKCMTTFLETYPHLTGFGITVGENMPDKEGRTAWSWETHGQPFMKFAQANPGRDLVFIHRNWYGSASDIIGTYGQLHNVPNARLDMSFKYSFAHMHSTPKPGYINGWLDNLDNVNLKTWLELRNDDFYFLHWGDPEYARAYVKAMPDKDRYLQGTLMGSDGWVFTRVFTSKHPFYESRNMLAIERLWYMQKVWGRLQYNPNTSDDFFKSHLAFKFPEANADNLFKAWSDASKAIRKANEQITETFRVDWKGWFEGWIDYKKWISLDDIRKANPQNGSNLCTFENTAHNNCQGKVSAWDNANNIEYLAKNALGLLDTTDAGSNVELSLTLKNLRAMSYLSLYMANKYRAAIYLEQDKKNEARDAMGIGYCYWEKYTNVMDELFIGVDLQRVKNMMPDWHAWDDDALKDYTDVGGEGEPDGIK